MRFEIEVRFADGGETWWEPYEKPIEDPVAFGRDLIEWFNRGSRPGERRREFVSAREVNEAEREHVWEKTNLVTLTDPRRDLLYDTAKCTRCGVTGRRYGLRGAVTRDKEFKAASYARCDWAMKLIARREARLAKAPIKGEANNGDQGLQ